MVFAEKKTVRAAVNTALGVLSVTFTNEFSPTLFSIPSSLFLSGMITVFLFRNDFTLSVLFILLGLHIGYELRGILYGDFWPFEVAYVLFFIALGMFLASGVINILRRCSLKRGQ